MDKKSLKDVNGTRIYEQRALRLKEQGIKEEDYRRIFVKRHPEVEQKRVDWLMDILFHTF